MISWKPWFTRHIYICILYPFIMRWHEDRPTRSMEIRYEYEVLLEVLCAYINEVRGYCFWSATVNVPVYRALNDTTVKTVVYPSYILCIICPPLYILIVVWPWHEDRYTRRPTGIITGRTQYDVLRRAVPIHQPCSWIKLVRNSKRTGN